MNFTKGQADGAVPIGLFMHTFHMAMHTFHMVMHTCHMVMHVGCK